jgi:protein phosphatase 2C family protein 2/3
LVGILQIRTKTSGVSVEQGPDLEDRESEFIPIVRSGACTDIGLRPKMEDVYVCVDNFTQKYGLKNMTDGPTAFYGVILFSYYY